MTNMAVESFVPAVSVMIPTFRQERFISDAINSALDQDYPNLEVVVADDASPDRTFEIASSIKDERLKVIRNNHNLGRVGNYRNLLYHLVEGSWVVNLDGDDYFTDNSFIASAIGKIEKEREIVAVCGRIETVSTTGHSISLTPGEETLDGLEVLSRLEDVRYRMMHPSTLYHRATALNCDFYRVNISSSDWESLFRLIAHGKVAYIDDVVAAWRLHDTNASQFLNWRDLIDNQGIWFPIYEEAVREGMDNFQATRICERVVLAQAYRDFVRLLIKNGYADALQYAKAIRKDVLHRRPGLSSHLSTLGQLYSERFGAGVVKV